MIRKNVPGNRGYRFDNLDIRLFSSYVRRKSDVNAYVYTYSYLSVIRCCSNKLFVVASIGFDGYKMKSVSGLCFNFYELCGFIFRRVGLILSIDVVSKN